ncbi:hypothetical protein ABPG75_004747 [Micractinium tetrahymenae]
MTELQQHPLKRLRIEQGSSCKPQTLLPSPHGPAASPSAAAAATASAGVSPTAASQPSAMASSAPPAYPQRGQPATTPQQTLPTIPESHEEALAERAEQPAGPCCAWPAADAWSPRGQPWLEAALAAAETEEEPEEQKRWRPEDATAAAAAAAGPPPRRRRVEGMAADGAGAAGQEYCLAVSVPRAIPAAVLSLAAPQAAHCQQQLQAAWAVVPYTLLPADGSVPRVQLPDGAVPRGCATPWHLQAVGSDQGRKQVGTWRQLAAC